MSIKVCIISDTHSLHRQITIPPCDLLLHCGDFSTQGLPHEMVDFLDWFSRQPASHHVYIAGNHDISYEKNPDLKAEMLNSYPEIHYLENSGVQLFGLNIWGSPWTPEFYPERWAFNYKRNSHFAHKLYSRIPTRTDILITHGPPKNILDGCDRPHPLYPQEAGCELLRQRIEELGQNLKLHAMGHIHECRGLDDKTSAPTWIVNASTCTATYRPTNKPVVIEIDNQGNKKVLAF